MEIETVEGCDLLPEWRIAIFFVPYRRPVDHMEGDCRLPVP